MVLLSPSIKALRELLSICERFAQKHGLIYNVNKTELVVFKAGKGPDVVLPTFLNGTQIKQSKFFKYLGHIVSEDLKDNLDLDRERRALSVKGNMLKRRFANCTDAVKLSLFKAYCQSFYTGSLWIRYSKSSYNALRVQYNNVFRALMHLPRSCSASLMFVEARVDTFQAIMRKRCFAVESRMTSSQNSIVTAASSSIELTELGRHWRGLQNAGC